MQLAFLVVAAAAHLVASTPVDYSSCSCASPYQFRSFIIAMGLPQNGDRLDATVQQPQGLEARQSLNGGDLSFDTRFPAPESSSSFYPKRYDYSLQTPAAEQSQQLQQNLETRINRWDFSPPGCQCHGPCTCRPPAFAPMAFPHGPRHRRSLLTGSEEQEITVLDDSLDKTPVKSPGLTSFENSDAALIESLKGDDWEVERMMDN